MSERHDVGAFVITFTRSGEYDVSLPADFVETDWAVLDRVIPAVREAIVGANRVRA